MAGSTSTLLSTPARNLCSVCWALLKNTNVKFSSTAAISHPETASSRRLSIGWTSTWDRYNEKFGPKKSWHWASLEKLLPQTEGIVGGIRLISAQNRKRTASEFPHSGDTTGTMV